MHTVISAFNDSQAAQRAVQRLVDAGFARDDVHLQAPSADDVQDAELGERTMHSPEREVAFDRGVLSSYGHFFTSLFGLDHPAGHAQTYTEAVRRGKSVVVVDAPDDQQADRASGLMRELGGSDGHVVQRDSQPLRDIVKLREDQRG
ncbi:MAG TPA: hypothetical protein VKP68_09530 [Ramlibacter sp.]|nr:hypothetical protein [Ramlibacter sp.]